MHVAAQPNLSPALRRLAGDAHRNHFFIHQSPSAGSKPVALFAWRIEDDGAVTPLPAKLDILARLRDIMDAML